MSDNSVSERRSSPALRWLGYFAFAVIFAIACSFLANWQFTRNADRSVQLELVERNYDAPALPLAELVPADGSFDPGDQWHPTELTGSYLTEATVLVRNRPHGGTAAFEVLVPFQSNDGRILVINRGWVPPASDSSDPAAVPAPPEGEVNVIVRLRAGEPLPSSGRSAPAGQLPTIHLPLVASTLNSSSVITSTYGVMVSETPSADTVPGALPSPSDDPGPHLSYAIQWILFALMGFVFIWYMIRTERRHSREDAEDAAKAQETGDPIAAAHARAMRRERSRDRDSEVEDAILDHADR